MARLATKCGDCGDLMWFRDEDAFGQSVVCPCGSTMLDEGGASGNPVEPTPQELEGLD